MIMRTVGIALQCYVMAGCIVMSLQSSVSHDTISDEGMLIQSLLRDYEPRARAKPRGDINGPVLVELGMHMLDLHDIDTKLQQISVIGFIAVTWYDLRLCWNESEYGGLGQIALNPTDVWVPTFVMGNTVAQQLFSEEWYTINKVQVFSDGRMYWSPGGTLEANCYIDVMYFPFDDQICEFMFQNWIYTGDLVNLTYKDERGLMDFYNGHNTQWDIIDIKTVRQDKYFVSPKPYPEVHFGIHVRRKPLYYVMNIILLSVLLAVLVLLVFKLTPESGERISMGVTLMLSFSIFTLMIDNLIPQTSVGVPMIITYLVLFMALTAMAIMESVFILYCYHHTGEDRPPKIIRIIVLNIIGKCLKRSDKRQDNIELDSLGRVNKSFCGSSSYDVNTASSKPTSNTDELNNDISGMEKSYNPAEELNSETSNIAEWKKVAALVDSFFYWLFVISFSLLIVILLVTVPLAQPKLNINNTELWAGF